MGKSVLVLGASGMLGHKMLQVLSKENSVCGTVRDLNVGKYELISEYPLIGGVDATKFDTVSKAIKIFRPDIVVNCIGIIKQLPESNDVMKSMILNSVLPHKLATYCAAHNSKLVHISTDCIFSGNRGMYRESDISDVDDIYGLTKYVGEINDFHNITLRTSIIGREIITQHGLVEWFLSNRGKTVNGYRKSIFSGVTTIELSRIVNKLLKDDYMRGLYNVVAEPVTKFDLITNINKYICDRDRVNIVSVDGENIDRSLDGSTLYRFNSYQAPSWDTMIKEMMTDITPYDEIRSRHV